jgi:formylmethanofuran dehydrogenase subunit B
LLKNACKIGNAKFQAIVVDHRIGIPLINVGGKLQNTVGMML